MLCPNLAGHNYFELGGLGMRFGLAEDSTHNIRKALSRYLARGECLVHAAIIITNIIIIIYNSTHKSAH